MRPMSRASWSQRVAALVPACVRGAALLHLSIATAWRRIGRSRGAPAETTCRIVLFAAIGDPTNPHVPGLGDLISKNAFLRILAEAHPKARICLVAGRRLVRRYSEFLLNHAYVSEVIECPDPGEGGPREWLSFLRRMRAYRFDLCVVDPSSSGLRAPHAYLCGIPRRVGAPQDHLERQLLTSCVLLQVGAGGSMPDALDVTMEYIRAVGVTREITVQDCTPRFPYRQAAGAAEDSSRLVVAVHAGGDAHWNRRWPLEKFVRLCERLCCDASLTVYLVGGATEWEENEVLRERVRNSQPHASIHNQSGGTLNDMATHLDRARLFVGNDSAPMHIAAALGKPVVVVCGPIGPELWKRMYNAHVINRDYGCSRITEFSQRRHRERERSCEEFACSYSYDPRRPAYPRCLADIEVEEVWSAVVASLPGSDLPACRRRGVAERSCAERNTP